MQTKAATQVENQWIMGGISASSKCGLINYFIISENKHDFNAIHNGKKRRTIEGRNPLSYVVAMNGHNSSTQGFK